MMIPESGRNSTLTWIVEPRGMRSQTTCRNIAKVEPTTDDTWGKPLQAAASIVSRL